MRKPAPHAASSPRWTSCTDAAETDVGDGSIDSVIHPREGVVALEKQELYDALKADALRVSTRLGVLPHTVVSAMCFCNFDLSKVVADSEHTIAAVGSKLGSCNDAAAIRAELEDIFVPFSDVAENFSDDLPLPDVDTSDPLAAFVDSLNPKSVEKQITQAKVYTSNNNVVEYLSHYLAAAGFSAQARRVDLDVSSTPAATSRDKIHELRTNLLSGESRFDPLHQTSRMMFDIKDLSAQNANNGLDLFNADSVPTLAEHPQFQDTKAALILQGFSENDATLGAFVSPEDKNVATNYLFSPQKDNYCFELECAELAEKYPYLISYPKVVSMLFHLYKTSEEISERIESKTIESAFLRRTIAEARYAADHPDQKRFAMEEIDALCRQETQQSDSTRCLPQEHSDADSATEECLVCGEEVSTSDFFALECGHKFCTSCWKEYIGNNSGNVFMMFKTKCMANGCECRVGLNAYKKFVSFQAYTKMLSFLITEFVDKNPNMIWCGNPARCPCAVSITNAISRNLEVVCKCNFRQCFHCRAQAHLPASCDEKEEWNKQINSDKVDDIWIMENTKKCPNCKVFIEKNEGCMHMTCKHCGYEFCWLCKGPWSKHGSSTGGYYECNRYKEGVDYENDGVGKTDQARFIHFYRRFTFHSDSFGNLSKLLSLVKGIDRLLAEKHQSADFLHETIKVLSACKYILKNSYIKGYFISNPSEEELFSFIQANLESTSDALMQTVNEVIDSSSKVMENKSKIIHLTNVTKKFFNNFLSAFDKNGQLILISKDNE